MMALCMIMCLFATNAFAQEKVRGIETRLVAYDKDGDKEDIYGIEFTNRNSISVSITMELWEKGSWNRWRDVYDDDRLSQGKDIVLEPGESYLWKIEKKRSSDGSLYEERGSFNHYYYYKYEAYKLQ